MSESSDRRATAPPASLLQLFWIFLRLGLTSFGGPIAHLAYFREEFVVRRRWLEDPAFADLVALCQFLPGPASSQVNLAIGLHRRGWLGALAAWLGFTLPSALLLVAFAYGMKSWPAVSYTGWFTGLKLAAVAVVAQAVWAMGTKFCREPTTVLIAILGALLALTWASPLSQVSVIGVGSLMGWLFFRHRLKEAGSVMTAPLHLDYGRRFGGLLLIIFLILLFGLPLSAVYWPDSPLQTFASFYQAGSLVFGGGHVVLPLLQTATVDSGWVDHDQFLAGYGLTQAVPGPLFTFAAFLGSVMKPEPHGWLGGLWCLLAIYVPAALLIFGTLPFWEKLRHRPSAQAALKGANAAVVGLLLAALYHPIWTSGVHNLREFLLALAAFGLLVFAQWAPWLVVAFCVVAGWILFANAT